MTKAETTERVGGYRIVRRLATGGTSDVLLAKAEGPHGFERTVVLKLLLSQFRNDDEFARMFAREASAYARLAHPSIVRLFDFFAQPASNVPNANAALGAAGGRDGQLVMVLEYVDGPPLTRLRSMLKAVGKELDDRAAIYIAGRVFDALAAAHSATDDAGNMAPVIHRDVNPSNVLMSWDGHVKLADFGVAKVTGSNHQSVAGMIKGTYGYMAPEQVTGEPITPRADVYAGAIILWELLARRRAFQRGALPEMEALRAMAEPRLMSLDTARPDVDKGVRDAVKRALEPQAKHRTITAEEMVSVLTSIVPIQEGRERLVTALGFLRNDSRAVSVAAASSSESLSPTEAVSVRTAPVPTTSVQNASVQNASVQNASVQNASVQNASVQNAPAPPPATIKGGLAAPPPLPPPNAHPSRGMLPKAMPPRPPSVPRFTAPYGATATPPSSPEPPKTTSRTNLPTTTLQSTALTAPPRPASRTLPATIASTPGPSTPGVGTPTPHAKLASAPEPTAAGASPLTISPRGSIVPSGERVPVGDPPLKGAHAPSAAAAGTIKTSPRGETPAIGMAIDEILRGVPSSMPPNMLHKTPPPLAAVPTVVPAGNPTTSKAKNVTLLGGTVAPETTTARAVGELPAAPAPLEALTALDKKKRELEREAKGDANSPRPPSDFSATVREMIAQAEAPTVAPPPSSNDPGEGEGGSSGPKTPRMFPVAPSSPRLDRTLAMDVRPDSLVKALDKRELDELPRLFSPPPAGPIPTPPPPTGATPATTTTGAMRLFAPPPPPPVQAPPPPPTPNPPISAPQNPVQNLQGHAPAHAHHDPSSLSNPNPNPNPNPSIASHPPANDPSAPGIARPTAQDSGALASIRPRRVGMSVAAIVTILVLVTGAGVAGTVAVVRYQKAHADMRSMPAVPARPSEVPTTAAFPSAAPTPTEQGSAASLASSTAPSLIAPVVSEAPPSKPLPGAGSTTAAAPVVVPSASATATPTSTNVIAAEGMGVLMTTGTAPGRRIFVDEKTVGQTPDSVTIACGSHSVRLGSSGKPQKIDVPCGGEITVGDKF